MISTSRVAFIVRHLVGMQTTRIQTSIIGTHGTSRATMSLILCHTFEILSRVLVDRLIGNLNPTQRA